MMMSVKPLDDRLPLNRLGEGAYWDSDSDTLYWVDIESNGINCYHVPTGGHRHWRVSKQVSFAYPDGTDFILCMADGIYRFDPRTRSETPVALLDLPGDHRLNDGKLDPTGRLLVGTINTAAEPSETAALYVLRGPKLEEMESGYVNANGKVWSMDGTLMYHADTSRGTIWEYDYDLSAGTISGKRVFVTLPGERPDGLSIDRDGNVIAAMYGGGCLKILSHRGNIVGRIDLPVPNPTSSVLAGSALYITTAFDGMSPRERRNAPFSGQILVAAYRHPEIA